MLIAYILNKTKYLDLDFTSEYISAVNRTQLITKQWTYLLNCWTSETRRCRWETINLGLTEQCQRSISQVDLDQG
jgi:hypothetical protein